MGYLDIGIIIFYLLLTLGIGFYANKKQKGVDDYYVGGRSVGSVSLMCLWMSAWIGGTSVMGTSSKAYEIGISAVWYVGIIGVGIVLFALVMVKPVKKLGDKLNNLTFPDFIESRYDSKTRLAATVTTILAYVAYTASQFVAGASILYAITGWELWVCFVVVMAVIVVYTSFGGFLAVTYTDVVQMFLLILGIVVLGIPMASGYLQAQQLSIRDLPDSYFDIGAWGWSGILALGLSTIFSFFTSMDSYTKCFAAKDVKTAHRGTFMAAGAVVVIAVVSTYLGLAARVAFPALESGSNSLAVLVIHAFPAGLKGMAMVGVLAAIMSTGDVCMLTTSANITRDIYQRYINPDVTERKMMVLGVCSSLGVGAVSAVFAWMNQDIIDVLFIAFTINSAGLFLPTVCGLFWRKSSSNGAFASILTALVIVIVWYVGAEVSDLALFKIEALWPAFGISAIVYLIICLTGKQTEKEKEKIEEFLLIKR